MKSQVPRAERSAADRDAHPFAMLAASQSRHEVERATDARAPELDWNTAAIQLDRAERVEREPPEVRRDRRDPRERHAVDQHDRVSGCRATHGDRFVCAESAEGSRLR